jgi:predicted dehydrogenase
MSNQNNHSLKGILVGCGFMGGMHAQIYAQLKGVELVAAVDAYPESSAEKLKSFNTPVPVYTTLEEAFEKTDCDFVDICLPTNLHKCYALTAIEAGKALFCEKPLALSLAEADKIVAAAKAKGTFAQVGHCIRFWPEYQALMDYHQSGKGGKLLSLNLVRRSGRPAYGVANWLNDVAQSGGAALDLHIHDTDFVLALLGEPNSFTSRVTEDFSGPVHVFTYLDYEGLIVSTEGGWNYPAKWGFQMTFQALYENAVLDYDSSNEKGLMICEDENEPQSMEVAKPESGESTSGEGNVSDLGGYYNELLYFTNCLKECIAPTIATLEDARASLALTLNEIQSAQIQNSVRIPE